MFILRSFYRHRKTHRTGCTILSSRQCSVYGLEPHAPSTLAFLPTWAQAHVLLPSNHIVQTAITPPPPGKL
jgi:hypothetical protein